MVKKSNMMNMDKQTEGRIIALETKLAYLEDFVNQLQNAAAGQEKTIERLQAENSRIAGKLQDLSDSLEEIPDRRPPHY
jgi:SlyX protein